MRFPKLEYVVRALPAQGFHEGRVVHEVQAPGEEKNVLMHLGETLPCIALPFRVACGMGMGSGTTGVTLEYHRKGEKLSASFALVRNSPV